MIRIEHVSLTMPGLDGPILSDVSYEIAPGDFVILLGSNGSGKSSLLKLLNREYSPTQGDIFIDDKPLRDYSYTGLSHQVVTLTQNCHDSLFVSLTLFENYLLVKHKYQKEFFALSHKKARKFFAEYVAKYNVNLANKLDMLVEKLSGGEKQALALALAVLYPPKILLLDEHTSALDPKTAKQLMELTNEVVTTHKITCLLTTHDLSIANQYGNRLVALRNGEVYKTLDWDEKSKQDQQGLFAMCY